MGNQSALLNTASAMLRTRDAPIHLHFIFKRGKKVKSKGLNVTRSTEIVYLCSEHLSCY